ncbi:MAG: regulatory protein RecX [Clostridia bacterium]|nr:regulatory protein RecX [Clostridia bacterium]
MRITEAAVRRRRLYLLRLEDGREMPVDRQTFDESGYAAGGEITEEQLDSLLARSQYNRARDRALYLLGLRDYACRELEQKLYAEATPEIAAAVVARLQEVGLLDDGRYACRLAKSLTEQKQYPRRRVEQELRRRGIDPLIAQEAVSGLDGEDFQQALALIEKKYYNKMKSAEDRQRVTAALARRGFTYGAIRRAMEAYGAADDEETEEWL